MELKKFVEDYLEDRLPDTWAAEVLLIAQGKSSKDSAAKRGVTTDAVKAQRKKIFKALAVEDSRELLLKMFHYAVTKTK